MPEPAALSVLAFDFGVRRIGVATGNTMTGAASPLEIIDTEMTEPRFARIAHLIATWMPRVLVVGMPCHPDGTPHELSQRCQRFSNQLRGRFGLPVENVDERYSSAVIETSPTRKAGMYRDKSGGMRRKPIDDQAAAVILQQYFDELASGGRILPLQNTTSAPSASSSSSPDAASPVSGVNLNE